MSMNKLLSALLLTLALPVSSTAAEFFPFAGPQPIAVLIQTDPWAMVVGSDTPLYALYENGDLIYFKKSKAGGAYFKRTLSKEELEAVKAKLLSFGDYEKIKRHHTLTPVTDRPETEIYLAVDGKKLTTTIYGLGVREGLPTKPTKIAPAPLPASLQKLYAYLLATDSADAREWTPKYIEAMVWGYDYAPDESVHWPKDWPGLTSPFTIQRHGSYSIFLPGGDRGKLSALMAARKEKGAIEIDGKKWAVSMRNTFPSEPVWRKAFAEAE